MSDKNLYQADIQTVSMLKDMRQTVQKILQDHAQQKVRIEAIDGQIVEGKIVDFDEHNVYVEVEETDEDADQLQVQQVAHRETKRGRDPYFEGSPYDGYDHYWDVSPYEVNYPYYPYANPYTAVSPYDYYPSTANPNAAVSPYDYQPGTANPYMQVSPYDYQPGKANPYTQVSPYDYYPSTANPNMAVSPYDYQPSTEKPNTAVSPYDYYPSTADPYGGFPPFPPYPPFPPFPPFPPCPPFAPRGPFVTGPIIAPKRPRRRRRCKIIPLALFSLLSIVLL